MSDAHDVTSPIAVPAGLRERKKLKTRRLLQETAFRLFEERGFGATTLDDIVEAAEVSRSTFFRYFESKHDVVWSLGWSTAELLEDWVRTCDASTDADIVRFVFGELAKRYDSSPETRAIATLIAENPDLAARSAQTNAEWAWTVAYALAARSGDTGTRPTYGQRVASFVGAGVWRAAFDRWYELDGEASMSDIVEAGWEAFAEMSAVTGERGHAVRPSAIGS